MNAVPVLFAVAIAVAPVATAAEGSGSSAAAGAPTVAVSGQASDDAKPDVARVSLSINVEKPTAAEAASENARRAEAVIAGLKAAGVEAKDIATVGLSLYPVWNNSQNQPRVASAYQATNRIAVRVQPIDKAGALIAQAVANGADYQGVDFDVSDREAREDALRVKAVENAAHRAELYARGAAMKLGSLQSILAEATQPVYRPLMEAAHSFKAAGAPISAADRTRLDHAERNRLGDLDAHAALSASQPAARNAAYPAARSAQAGQSAAAETPIVAMNAIALVAGVRFLAHDVDQRLAAEIARQPPGRRLVDPHQRRLDDEPSRHAEIECDLQRLDRVVATVGIARIVGLAHARHQPPEAAAIGERGGEGEKHQIAARDERIRQAVGARCDGDVARHRAVGDSASAARSRTWSSPSLRRPMRERRCDRRAQFGADFQLNSVALAIVEADRLDPVEAVERPGQTRRRILAAGKQHQRVLLVHRSVQFDRRRFTTASTARPVSATKVD